MDKKLTFVTIVVLLNSIVMLVGFGYLHNEIIELKTEESDLPEVPAPTEPEQLQEPEPEPTPEPEPEPQLTPEPDPQPEPELQQPAEPEPAEPIHKLMAPEANLTVVSWEFDDTRGSGEGGVFEATVEGDVVNPNNCTLYNVEICLDFHIMQGRTAIVLGFFSEKRTINVGTMVAGRSIKIKPQTYGFVVIDWSSLHLNNFCYTVNWDESR